MCLSMLWRSELQRMEMFGTSVVEALEMKLGRRKSSRRGDSSTTLR